MLDMENEIFHEVSQVLRTKYPDIYITGEELNAPSRFPCVSLVEIQNKTYRKTRTMDCKEHHAELTYEVQVFSNLHTGRKAQCREIANTIDEYLVSHAFSRNMLYPVPNMDDSSIYRVVGRYKVIADNITHTLHMR